MPAPVNTFGFFYPTFAAYDAGAPGSAAWIPHRGPVAGGAGGGTAGIQRFTGRVTQLHADRRTFSKTQEFDPFSVYTYVFDNLDDDDKSEFFAFDAVANGAEFEVYDTIDEVYFMAQLMPESAETSNWQIDIPFGERWSTVVHLFRDEVS